MLHREHLACATEAGLNLICDQQHIKLGAQVAHALQVAVRRNDDASFTLDRLNADGANVWILDELSSQVCQVIILEHIKAGRERTEICVASRVITGT